MTSEAETIKRDRRRWSQSRDIVRVALVIVVAVVCFRLLGDLPFPFARFLELPFMALGLAFVFIRYMLLSLLRGGKLQLGGFDIYVLVLMLILPFHSAWRAHDVFGQPLLYGVLAQRALCLVGVVLLLLHWMRRGLVTGWHVERSLIYLAWFWLVFCIFFVLFINPAIFVADYPAFATGSEIHGYKYKFDPILLVFGGTFYLFRGLISRRSVDYLAAAVFLGFILFVIDKRSLTLAILVSYALLAWFFLKKKRFFIVAVKSLFAGVLMLLALVLAAPDFVSQFIEHYIQATSVVATGETGEDASSNARIIETLMAWPYIQRNWLFGNGDLSVQWQDGFLGAMGYFYPSDIGIIGGLFVYGLWGLILCYAQYFFAFFRGGRLLSVENRFLYIACYGLLAVLFTQSLIRGDIIFSPTASLFFIAVLLGLRNQVENYANKMRSSYCEVEKI